MERRPSGLAAGLLMQSFIKSGRTLRFTVVKRPLRHKALALSLSTSLVGRIRGWLSAEHKSPNTFGHPARRVTDSLLLLNAACFAAQLATRGKFTLIGVKSNSAIRGGQWWRLITCAFLHGGWWHITMNAFCLHSIGPLLERLSGRRRYLAVYVTSALAGSVLSFLRSPALSLGASGALFGLTGALAVFLIRHRDRLGAASDSALRGIAQSLLINLVIGLSPAIDNWGHVGGFLGGIGAAYLLGPRFVNQGRKTVDRPILPIFSS